MPHESVIKSLYYMKPSFMKMLIGTQLIKTILSTKEDCIVKILIEFVQKEYWKKFSESNSELHISRNMFILSKLHVDLCSPLETCTKYPKLHLESLPHNTETSLNYIVQVLYITLEAYLAAYNVQRVQEKLDLLNDKLLQSEDDTELANYMPGSSYFISEGFIKKYVYIFKKLKELVITFQGKKQCGLPQIMMVFKKVGLLDL